MVVVITGASAGIGRQLAIDLHTRGAKLVLAARRVELLEELKASLPTTAGGVTASEPLIVRSDVSVEADCTSLIDASLSRFGRIDTLVANAGFGIPSTIVDTSSRQVQDIFQTNVFGTLDCIRPAIPVMLRQPLREGLRGQVMIVSSGAARRGLPYFGVYSATKAAQLSIAEALRVELKDQQIAVTSVHPIGTETDFFKVAETKGPAKIESPMRVSGRQTVSCVTRAMVRAIERPKREVWTSFPTRLGLALNAMFPSIGDAVMNKMRREIDRLNRP